MTRRSIFGGLFVAISSWFAGKPQAAAAPKDTPTMLPTKIVSLVAETVNGSRNATCIDENGVVYRGSLGCSHVTMDGDPLRGCFAANAREGWADVRDKKAQHAATDISPQQPHGVPTKRVYGDVEIRVSAPLDRIDAKMDVTAIEFARDAVRALRHYGANDGPMDWGLGLANQLEKALNDL